jgi:hypothetical protein
MYKRDLYKSRDRWKALALKQEEEILQLQVDLAGLQLEFHNLREHLNRNVEILSQYIAASGEPKREA